jgi:hypothetical protein
MLKGIGQHNGSLRELRNADCGLLDVNKEIITEWISKQKRRAQRCSTWSFVLIFSAEVLMAELNDALAQKISDDPQAERYVIIRVTDDVEASADRLQARGFQIRRKLKLIRGIAATATGAQVQALAQEPWVSHIEEDAQVHTM